MVAVDQTIIHQPPPHPIWPPQSSASATSWMNVDTSSFSFRTSEVRYAVRSRATQGAPVYSCQATTLCRNSLGTPLSRLGGLDEISAAELVPAPLKAAGPPTTPLDLPAHCSRRSSSQTDVPGDEVGHSQPSAVVAVSGPGARWRALLRHRKLDRLVVERGEFAVGVDRHHVLGFPRQLVTTHARRVAGHPWQGEADDIGPVVE